MLRTGLKRVKGSAVISPSTPLVLGSASPRRRELLATVGMPLRVVPGAADEEVHADEAPAAYLERIVEEKLTSVADRLDGAPVGGVLVADTIVVVDDAILGKPGSVAEAATLVGRLVGRAHVVSTRYALARAAAPGRSVLARTVSTRVVMRSASAEEVHRYAATGEGLDKAGAYAVQGLGSFLVARVEGSYTNVVGLPLCELVCDLRSLGLIGAFP